MLTSTMQEYASPEVIVYGILMEWDLIPLVHHLKITFVCKAGGFLVVIWISHGNIHIQYSLTFNYNLHQWIQDIHHTGHTIVI